MRFVRFAQDAERSLRGTTHFACAARLKHYFGSSARNRHAHQTMGRRFAARLRVIPIEYPRTFTRNCCVRLISWSKYEVLRFSLPKLLLEDVPVSIAIRVKEESFPIR